jgi:hypothetical protein
MLSFLLFSVLTLVVLAVAGMVFVHLAVGALVWLVLLPFRLLFKLLFGLGGLLLGVLVAPMLAVVAVVGLAGAFVVALLSLLAPLVPLVLLAGFGWAVFRLFVSRRADSSAGDR